MSKQNMTYEITKMYDDGRTWTDKLVGKTALNKYEDILEDVMADNRKALVSTQKAVLGRDEEDIERKEELNSKAIRNAREKDREMMKSIINEEY